MLFVTDLFYLFIPLGGLKYEKNKNLKLRDINYPHDCMVVEFITTYEISA
jgi:hypothetical protein